MGTLPTIAASRLRALRKKKGLTLAEVAALAGVTTSAIQKLETSQRPLTLEWIERLAAALQVDRSELVAERQPHADVSRIPVIGRIAAGNWQQAVEDADGDMIDVVNAPKDAFALRADGDSMNKIVPDAGFVVINPHDRDLREGGVYAVMNGEGETTLKRYRGDPARLEPCSTNPAHHAIRLGTHPFTVIGRATGAVMRL